MTDERALGGPEPPAGLRGPGVEGAQNLLDPAVRAELRELLEAAVRGALEDVVADLLKRVQALVPQPLLQALAGVLAGAGAGQEPRDPGRAEASAREAAERPAAAGEGRFPYPHGDVDLRGIPANVPSAEERRPRRSGAERRFYFIPGAAEEPQAGPRPAAAKPG